MTIELADQSARPLDDFLREHTRGMGGAHNRVLVVQRLLTHRPKYDGPIEARTRLHGAAALHGHVCPDVGCQALV